MNKIIMMGTGAAPGVPSVSRGWGECNPNNPKNRRKRIGTYLEMSGQKLLIDTSPDLRNHLLDNNIKYLDAVLYTHAHADHLHGIDDLREINRVEKKPLDIYGTEHTIGQIKHRFSYLVSDEDFSDKGIYKASLKPHTIEESKALFLGNLKVNLLELSGHMVPSNGYIFNDGEVVYVADCKEIATQALSKIKIKPKVLVLPLTVIKSHYEKFYHMELDKVLEYVNLIKPEKAVINHMASECDWDEVNRLTPDNVFPAYDGMVIEF
ncbi:MAG: MBL fold metallo-hydrolase [Alphaproteobacteria bacterium]|nr:MBL fold metallo-hydrolase [Alphaproteobacteria bacterium]